MKLNNEIMKVQAITTLFLYSATRYCRGGIFRERVIFAIMQYPLSRKLNISEKKGQTKYMYKINGRVMLSQIYYIENYFQLEVKNVMQK